MPAYTTQEVILQVQGQKLPTCPGLPATKMMLWSVWRSKLRLLLQRDTD